MDAFADASLSSDEQFRYELAQGPVGSREGRRAVFQRTREEWLTQPLSLLPGLPVRTQNLLESKGVYYVQDLLACCPREEEACLNDRKRSRGWCSCRCNLRNPEYHPKAWLKSIPGVSGKTVQGILSSLRSAGFSVIQTPENEA